MGEQQYFEPKRDRVWWKEGLKTLQLSWRLIRDPLVPAWTKLIPLGALGYVLLPADLVPDILPLLGQMDDLAVILLGLRLFIRVCPQAVVEGYREEAPTITVEYDIRDDHGEPAKSRPALSDGEHGVRDATAKATDAELEHPVQTSDPL